jgi:hypothetical protein
MIECKPSFTCRGGDCPLEDDIDCEYRVWYWAQEEMARLYKLVPNWIACSEQMPPDGNEVLCRCDVPRLADSGINAVGVWHAREGDWTVAGVGLTPESAVTHWMLIPEMPGTGRVKV